MTRLAPFFPYYGSKWRSARAYPPPVYGQIVEPFSGSAGYALAYPDRDVLLIDARPQVAELWQWLVQVDPDEIRSLPLVPEGTTTDDFGLTGPARSLVGYWLNPGNCTPARRRSSFRTGRWRNKGWNEQIRERTARQVTRIRHWRVVLGDYTLADMHVVGPATWFIDPPYSGRAGRAYRMSPLDYLALASWARARQGQVIVCEGEGADWLPFRSVWQTIGIAGKSREAVFVAYSGGV